MSKFIKAVGVATVRLAAFVPCTNSASLAAGTKELLSLWQILNAGQVGRLSIGSN